MGEYDYEKQTGRFKTFTIHNGDVGTEAYHDHYVSDLQSQVYRLRGVCLLLADKLARYTGYTVPRELDEAEEAEAAGAEAWNPDWDCYVDDCGIKVNRGE